MNPRRARTISILTFLLACSPLFANGGAWQTGVPVTGNAAASDQKKSTNVTIEDEKLVIDLHQEFAAVEVRYRMKNTGAEVAQDFFFPVERWAPSDGEDAGTAQTDLEGYAISADGAEIKWQNVDAKGDKPKAEKDPRWGEFQPGTRLWKKSSIPFAQGQTREILIRYRSPYAAIQGSVFGRRAFGRSLFSLFAFARGHLERPDREGKSDRELFAPAPGRNLDQKAEGPFQENQ